MVAERFIGHCTVNFMAHQILHSNLYCVVHYNVHTNIQRRRTDVFIHSGTLPFLSRLQRLQTML